VNCPRCSKEMLDVRELKTNPKAPDFQCPDASCLNDKGYRTGAWLPKGRSAPPRAVQGPPNGPSASQAPLNGPVGPSAREKQLGDLYWRCFTEVLTVLKQEKLVDMFHGDAIAAMAATLFIARSKVL